MNALDYLLAYASHGWPTFLLSEEKIPVRNCQRCRDEHNTPDEMEACTCLCCHGFYAATTVPGRLRAMADRHPRGLVAIRTGAPSGLVVVDVDPPDGLPTLAQLDEAGVLPGTVMQMTGRPDGFQMLYAHPGITIPSRPGGLGPGVDVKGDGGYIVAPPSIHPKTRVRYRWVGDTFTHPPTPLHALLVDRLKVKERVPSPIPIRRNSGPNRGRLASLLDRVLDAPARQGNAVLHWCACRAGDMVAAGEIDETTAADALLAAAVDRGRDSAEAWRTIRSGMRKGAA